MIAGYIKRLLGQIELGLVPEVIHDFVIYFFRDIKGDQLFEKLIRPADGRLSFNAARNAHILLSLNPQRHFLIQKLCQIAARIFSKTSMQPSSMAVILTVHGQPIYAENSEAVQNPDMTMDSLKERMQPWLLAWEYILTHPDDVLNVRYSCIHDLIQ